MIVSYICILRLGCHLFIRVKCLSGFLTLSRTFSLFGDVLALLWTSFCTDLDLAPCRLDPQPDIALVLELVVGSEPGTLLSLVVLLLQRTIRVPVFAGPHPCCCCCPIIVACPIDVPCPVIVASSIPVACFVPAPPLLRCFLPRPALCCFPSPPLPSRIVLLAPS